MEATSNESLSALCGLVASLDRWEVVVVSMDGRGDGVPGVAGEPGPRGVRGRGTSPYLTGGVLCAPQNRENDGSKGYPGVRCDKLVLSYPVMGPPMEVLGLVPGLEDVVCRRVRNRGPYASVEAAGYLKWSDGVKVRVSARDGGPSLQSDLSCVLNPAKLDGGRLAVVGSLMAGAAPEAGLEAWYVKRADAAWDVVGVPRHRVRLDTGRRLQVWHGVGSGGPQTETRQWTEDETGKHEVSVYDKRAERAAAGENLGRDVVRVELRKLWGGDPPTLGSLGAIAWPVPDDVRVRVLARDPREYADPAWLAVATVAVMWGPAAARRMGRQLLGPRAGGREAVDGVLWDDWTERLRESFRVSWPGEVGGVVASLRREAVAA